jgi:hypothetical protein
MPTLGHNRTRVEKALAGVGTAGSAASRSAAAAGTVAATALTSEMLFTARA